MNLFLAMLAWLVMGTILGIGIWLMAVKGSAILLIAAAIGLVIAVGKIGCSAH